MPDMDAGAFARALKSDSSLAATKLLVMTSEEAALDAATSASLGFSGRIAKPPKRRAL